MNKIQHRIAVLAAMILLAGTGCKKYLEESNPAGRTAETYYGTAQGFEDLVRSNYAPFRGIINTPTLYWLGTDAFTFGISTTTNDINGYGSNLNSALADVDTYWKQLYYAIGLTNTTLVWSSQVSGLDAATVKVRAGEAKALRAYSYYLLAETFGDVPLVLTPSTEPTFGYARTSEQKVYDQVITDLTDAIAALPATATDLGRMTKGGAQHLLAKVYLTRAAKTYGTAQADYTQAATLAEAVISSGTYSLLPTFSALFDPSVSNFQVNKEIIFSIQYSTNTTTNNYFYITAPSTLINGNNLHQQFTMDMSVYPAISRSSFYNKSQQLVAPTSWFFSNFDKTRDARYLATVYNVIYAQVATGGFAVGDTVIYFPDVAWTAAQKASKKYYVYNPDEYSKPTTFSSRSFPSFKKFRETGLAYADNLGTRDTYVFRLGETYLIAAEAYLKLGNTAKALQYYNAIRSRAAKPGNNPATGVAYAMEMQVASLTIDDILDERARELAGEELRWFELKRTGKLVSRTLMYNDEAKAAGKLDAHFQLRPVPQSQIDLNRGEFSQNTGY